MARQRRCAIALLLLLPFPHTLAASPDDDAAWWHDGLALPDGDAFFRGWLADRVDTAAAVSAERHGAAAVSAGLAAACPPGGIAFVFDDVGDAFVLGLEGPSLEHVPAGRWPGAIAQLKAAGAAPSLVLFLHGRDAWHGVLSMSDAEKVDTFADALHAGLFRAAGPDGSDRARDAARLLPSCIAALDVALPADKRGEVDGGNNDEDSNLVAGRRSPARQLAPAEGECLVPAAAPVDCVMLSQENVSTAAPAWATPSIIRGLPPWPASLDWMEHFDWEPGPASDSDDSIEAQRAFIRIFDAYYGRPSFLPPTGNLRISYSRRGGGVSFCIHAFSWLRLLRGRKLWFFAPPDVPMPPNTHRDHCQDPREAPPAGVTHVCGQRENDVIIVPTLWWHATCNMEPDRMTMAIGSQGPEPMERIDRVHQADTALARVRDRDAVAEMIEKRSVDDAAERPRLATPGLDDGVFD